MKTINILDYLPNTISKREKHPAGYTILPKCVIARSGILQYSNVIGQDGVLINNGETINVYRPPSVIKKCLKYYNNLPLTIKHPQKGSVDPSTVQDVIVGITGGNAELREIENGEVEVVADIVAHDKDAIDILEKRKLNELSAGYKTAYKKERGVTNSKEGYEALQIHLMPNHVALVESGRCGSECRVCDDNENIISKGVTMKLLKTNGNETFRYFLRSDSEENGVIELSSEAFDELSKSEGAKVEELEEKDVEIQEDGSSMTSEKKYDEEVVEEEVPGVESEETPEDEKPSESSEIFEVKLEDGTVGKMDKVAYEYFKRYMEMQKKGDAMENAAEIMSLAATAERILGTSFQVDSYIEDGKFNATALKHAVIEKQMPNIVVKSLRNDDALDSMFQCAIQSQEKNVADWKADMISLSKDTKVVDQKDIIGSVEKARRTRLNIINRVEEAK